MSDKSVALLLKKYRDKLLRAINLVEAEVPLNMIEIKNDEIEGPIPFAPVMKPVVNILLEMDEDIAFLSNSGITDWGK